MTTIRPFTISKIYIYLLFYFFVEPAAGYHGANLYKMCGNTTFAVRCRIEGLRDIGYGSCELTCTTIKLILHRSSCTSCVIAPSVYNGVVFVFIFFSYCEILETNKKKKHLRRSI
jgi:hypothetical protein